MHFVRSNLILEQEFSASKTNLQLPLHLLENNLGVNKEAAQKAVKLRVVTVKGFKSLYNNIHDGKSHVSDNGDGSLPLFNFKPIYLDENADGEVKR